MGRGHNRKPRNFATFRLCPRPGAADASDRVFVRVDGNPYSVPGFADDDGHGHGVGPSASSSLTGGEDGPSSSADGGALPDHVRREILELGLPDDSRRPARSGLSVDVKAYDLSRAPIGSREVAEAVRRVEEAVDADVAKLLDGSDLPAIESADQDLEEDFVVLANQLDEEQQVEAREKNVGVIDNLVEDEVEGGVSKEKAREQFDSLALEEYADGKDACHARDVESSTKEQIGVSSNGIIECAGFAGRYELREGEQVVLVPESSNVSAVRYRDATVASSYLHPHHGKTRVPENAKKKLPKFAPGETSMKKAIIKKGMEKLPAEYLPQRKTSNGER